MPEKEPNSNTTKQIEKLEKKVEKTGEKVKKVQENVEQQKEQNKELKQELSRLQKIQKKATTSAKVFKSEFNKTLSTALIAAFGIIIALAWKDVVTEWINRITNLSHIQSRVIEAIIITIISVIAILIITNYLSPAENKK